MDNSLFSKFAPLLRAMTETELSSEIEAPRILLIDSAVSTGKRVDVAFAPFDHVNLDAKIVIVGLTPGRQQMRNALVEAHRCLKTAHSYDDAMRSAKVFASFSGPMRTNLVAMLDSIGVNRALDITSTADFWKEDSRHAHFTSALRYPVFVNGENFSGTPSMLSTPILYKHLMQWFAAEVAAIPNAIFVPLGPKVTEAVNAVAQELRLNPRQVLSGLAQLPLDFRPIFRHSELQACNPLLKPAKSANGVP